MSTPDPDSVAAATAALDRVRNDWMRREGVVSLEVARAHTHAAGRAGGVCVRVTVRPDAPNADFPAEVDGVRVEVVTGRGPVPEEAPDAES